MNKLSGYREITLSSGEVVELKFCNGSTEIYGQLTGLKTLSDIDASLDLEYVQGMDEAGNPALVPNVTTEYLKGLRLFVYSAALYAARVQNKPINFNEWTAAEWIEDVGTQAILANVDIPEADTKKNETPQPEAVSQ
ncbi:hypothetical protein GO755_00065 [Spirosoma sp. HMF4905]|uniref:Uncharacterized protein n=1 Tax=Spirosoma arboris TaxID=2682092 RepID=A0A7K1S474_9BACT|nr:hypothetical protein [Spirosoma arboris]MVM28406.1 hypothetical protein [Spirosoma arboris]